MDNSNISGLDVNNNLDVDKILEVARGLDGARGLGVGRGGRGLEIGPLQPFDYERASDIDNIHGYYEYPFVETPDTEGVIASSTIRWKLGVALNAETSNWEYSVGIGLLDNVLSDEFDAETVTYVSTFPELSEVQVGIKLDLEVDVNAAGYVMPTKGNYALKNKSKSISFVAENFADFVFSAQNLPKEKTATGTAIIPLGKIIKLTSPNGEPPSFAVQFQAITTDLFSVYSPFDGMVIYR